MYAREWITRGADRTQGCANRLNSFHGIMSDTPWATSEIDNLPNVCLCIKCIICVAAETYRPYKKGELLRWRWTPRRGGKKRSRTCTFRCVEENVFDRKNKQYDIGDREIAFIYAIEKKKHVMRKRSVLCSSLDGSFLVESRGR